MPEKTEVQEPEQEQGIIPAQPEESSLAARHVAGVPAARAYQGASQLPITPEQAALLGEFNRVPEEELEIKPDDGAVYAPHSWYEDKLTRVFGYGNWALVPGSPLAVDRSGDWVVQLWLLYVNGCFVSQTIGQARYNPNNARTNKALAAESARSDSVPRLCAKSSLQIGANPWNKRFCDAWRAKNAILVKVRDRNNKLSEQWRRRDAAPLPGELNVQDEPDESTQIVMEDEAEQAPKTAEPNGVLTLVHHPESDTYEVRGPSEALKAAKPILDRYRMKGVKTVAIQPEQVDDMRFELERAKFALHSMKEAP